MCPESKSKTAAVPIKTFVFIDLESTGLPFLQRKIKMTEFSAIAVRRKSLLETQSTTDCIPRITNKISFVVNPVALIPDDVVQLTGIDNFMVEEMRPFDQNAAKILKNFLKTCDEPICLVAHNGYRFDFPLLKEELKNFPQIIPDNTLCIDSLEAFKIFAKVSQENGTPSPLITHTDVLLFETAVEAERTVSLSEDEILMAEAMKIEVNLQQKNETTPEAQIIGRTTFNENVNKAKRKLFPNTPSPVTTKLKVNYSLPFIFETLFHEPIDRKHQAESDAMALLRCIVKLGSPVLEYFDLHAKYFVDIKSLY